MNREAYKFFSGAFAALGYAHAAYAVATSRGIINEPVFLGRRWGVGFMWTEAAIYTALAVVLGRAGWGRRAEEVQSKSHDRQPAAVTPQVPPVSVN